jgi:hypothetical protein
MQDKPIEVQCGYSLCENLRIDALAANPVIEAETDALAEPNLAAALDPDHVRIIEGPVVGEIGVVVDVVEVGTSHTALGSSTELADHLFRE